MTKKKISPEMHYALSCKSVDDRTLNRYVFGLLAREIVRRPVKAPTLRILDTQGQSGVMLSRLLEWQLFERARYTQLTENQPHDEILDWWRTWSKTWNADLTQKKEDVYLLKHGKRRARVRLRAENLSAFIEHIRPVRYDLIIVHESPQLLESLPALTTALKPGGFLYAVAHPDGAPQFEPAVPEDNLLAANRENAPGKQIFHAVRQLGLRLLAIGASDAIVFPDEHGEYRADEAFYLRHHLKQIAATLDVASEEEKLAWLTAREEHLKAGRLFFFAHRYDFLAQKPLEEDS